jgi:hypothetical protein
VKIILIQTYMSMLVQMFCLLIYLEFLPYSVIFQLYDGGQFLLAEERTQIYCTMYLGRDHRPSVIKLTNFLTFSLVRA